MAVIAICVWTMASEINGTLKLARTWSRNGHHVCYVGVPECRQIVQENGFEFSGVLEKWLPAGSIEDQDFNLEVKRMPRWKRAQSAFRRKRRFERVLTELLRNRRNDVEETFRALKPDLVIIGTHTSHTNIFGFVAARMGIRCAYLTQQMIQSAPQQAPETQSSKPGQARFSLKRRYRRLLFNALNINYRKFYDAFLDATGLPPHRLDYKNARYPLRMPNLYPWPTPFELPGISHAQVIPIEAGIELDRYEDPTPVAGLPERSALVYCSFGTMLPLGVEATRRLFQTVIDCMRLLPDVQMVFAIGPFFRESEFGELPPNVYLCRQAPQMTMLKRCDMMITHGGSATVRECILLGVPMIVIPLGYESGEYAKRVPFHGLGFGADHRSLTANQLSGFVLALRYDPRYKQASLRMKASFEEWEARTPSLAAIETCLSAPLG